MSVELTKFDLVNDLKTPQDIAEYLEIVFETPEDTVYITRAIGLVARAVGVSQLARDAGLSREGIYKALGEGGNPSFASLTKILSALGLRFTVQPLRHGDRELA